jgi:hypothetical protein
MGFLQVWEYLDQLLAGLAGTYFAASVLWLGAGWWIYERERAAHSFVLLLIAWNAFWFRQLAVHQLNFSGTDQFTTRRRQHS